LPQHWQPDLMIFDHQPVHWLVWPARSAINVCVPSVVAIHAPVMVR
jgi:hypothetical protein